MKPVKLITTLLITGSCILICLVAAGSYFEEREYSDYKLKQMVQPIFHDVTAEYIGDSYGENKEEGYAYYKLLFEIENPCNYGMDTFYFYYQSTDSAAGYIKEIEKEEDTLIREWEQNFIPAGKTVNISRIVRVQEGCRGFDVVYENWGISEEQRMHIEL